MSENDWRIARYEAQIKVCRRIGLEEMTDMLESQSIGLQVVTDMIQRGEEP